MMTKTSNTKDFGLLSLDAVTSKEKSVIDLFSNYYTHLYFSANQITSNLNKKCQISCGRY